MKKLRILDWPKQRFYSETHPFYRWKKQFRENGLDVSCHHKHTDNALNDTDYLVIHSRYFDMAWQNINTRNSENTEQVISFLEDMRKKANRIIWFDAADSTGSHDFPIIHLVDVFLKKQVLKDKSYYTQRNNLRIWLNHQQPETPINIFEPCPVSELKKIKVGWNIGLNDYRYFGYKMSRLSNYLGYSLYPVTFSEVDKFRPIDLTFRGTIHKDKTGSYKVSEQRNKVLECLEDTLLVAVKGKPVAKRQYWKELRNSKLCVSPYGWGEICYRDFEAFISGSLLVKPSMEHLETYPNVFLPHQTYIPLNWDLDQLSEKLEDIIRQPQKYQEIAMEGQKIYKEVIYNSQEFIDHIKKIVS
ncbi:hypothetical protein Pedsa_0820 [Pseudopedobacter saltans DSM 12145]|uniref:Glycosyltransferase family 1 protein n=1 Tax=Pseudopedobacter saltans (strain ATCC 51119 / DSM 12145 / JCM 21818 / CCUG 39354 / LMG 10337 / NBRC 100064 / NCIMB 13643) TaxID=762903 RepID=F0S9N6_PSESL|nr:glycosyltransferase [Pseudopedobacter saltans]ADY51392.1 hypothetical protein Pedsa_0820 [Pseudopedobacter saltans DSM 12145]